jgi:hypothetical protein
MAEKDNIYHIDKDALAVAEYLVKHSTDPSAPNEVQLAEAEVALNSLERIFEAAMNNQSRGKP